MQQNLFFEEEGEQATHNQMEAPISSKTRKLSCAHDKSRKVSLEEIKLMNISSSFSSQSKHLAPGNWYCSGCGYNNINTAVSCITCGCTTKQVEQPASPTTRSEKKRKSGEINSESSPEIYVSHENEGELDLPRKLLIRKNSSDNRKRKQGSELEENELGENSVLPNVQELQHPIVAELADPSVEAVSETVTETVKRKRKQPSDVKIANDAAAVETKRERRKRLIVN